MAEVLDNAKAEGITVKYKPGTDSRRLGFLILMCPSQFSHDRVAVGKDCHPASEHTRWHLHRRRVA